MLRTKFVKNALTLFTGSVLGQAILLAFSPILSRLYSKEVFGIIFTFASLSVIFQIFSSLKLGLAIVLPAKDRHAINLLIIAMFVNFALNLFFFILIYLFYEPIQVFYGESNLSHWLYFVPLSSFLLSFFEIVSYWNNRTEQYAKTSYSKVTKATITVGSQSSFSFTSITNNGLILGSLLGQAVSALLLFLLSLKSIASNLQYFSIQRTRSLLRKYKNIPLYETLMNALNAISNQIPFLLVGSYFGYEAVALYGMASRIITVPTGLVAQSVGDVFYKTASDKFNKKEDLFLFVKKTYVNLIKVIILPGLLLFVSTFFFAFFFGDGWEQAGLYAAIMLPWVIIGFLNQPISWIVTILNKQKQASFFDFILLVARFLSIYLSYKLLFSATFAISMYALTGFLFGVCMIFYFLHLARNSYDH